MAAGLADSRGCPPQHTFFYPQDEYHPEYVQSLADLCRQGWGDLEIHLHHDQDTTDGLREKLLVFSEKLHKVHGMLRRDADGRLSYAFIHGNWALDNSHPEGRYCGVNDELSVLIETGCYADLTMPSAPGLCQTSTMNSLYYAQDDPRSPKSHNRGMPVRVGEEPPENSLLMIQGPLALDWSKKKWGLLPGLENGDLTANHPPTLQRMQLWLQAGVHVEGRSDWTFVKLHTHGAQEGNAEMFLGGQAKDFHQSLARFAAANDGFRYYYVTAFEMARFIKQAQLGYVEPDFSDSAPFPTVSVETSP